MKIKNLDTGVLFLTRFAKTEQCSKQTCLQIIVLLNITTKTSVKNGKQVNKNTQTTLQ